MQRRFRQALSCIKEHAYVSYAKVATAGGFCDLQLIVVKATSPDDNIPSTDRYVQDLLKIFSISPTSFRAFSLFFARRFAKTRCWRVAVKCLVLLHRLLRSLPDDASSSSSFRAEMLWARSNRFLTLYPTHFVDRTSSSSSHDYTIFIRSYARLLDEALDCFSINQVVGKEEECYYDEILFNKMKEVRGMLQVLPQLQSMIERAMECRPRGAAEHSFLVQSAMKHIVRDSFLCYTVFQQEVVGMLESMIEMSYRNCVAAFSIYKKAATQADELNEFYEWCKCVGLCGLHEYPLVDKIPQIQIQALENFLNGMWQLGDSPEPEPEPEPEGEETMQLGKEIGPLIDLGGESWEELLDFSISIPLPCIQSHKENNVECQMQIYHPCASNPFHDQITHSS